MTIDEYYSHDPASFGPIVSLQFLQTSTPSGGVEQTLLLELSKRPELGDARLTLIFHGVRGLVFRQPELSLAAVGLIEIRQTQSGFAVSEEEGELSLDCRSFDAVIGAA